MSPERKANQPLTREERNRAIGNYYLSLLLKIEPRFNDKRSFSLAHKAIAYGANHASIPPALVSQLGLEDLEWTWCGAGRLNSSPILRIGRPPEDGSMTTNADRATATIEVARRVDLSKGAGILSPFTCELQALIKSKIELLPQLMILKTITALLN